MVEENLGSESKSTNSLKTARDIHGLHVNDTSSLIVEDKDLDVKFYLVHTRVEISTNLKIAKSDSNMEYFWLM